MANQVDYSNFHKDLRKEQDYKAQANIAAFYRKFAGNYRALFVDYESDYGKYLQHAGVDRILVKENHYGTPIKQLWVQEKVTFNKYPKMMFEYEKKSGAKGWAISDDERAEWLLFYMDGTIYLIDFPKLREYLQANLKQFRAKYFFQTDNKNINVPITELVYNLNKDDIGIWIFEEKDYI